MTTVVDRHGKVHEVDFNKILTRLKGLLSDEEVKKVNIVEIAKKTIESIYPNITTQELDLTSANVCAEFVSSNPLYGFLGGRILASNLRKTLDNKNLKTFSQRVQYIHDNVPDYLKPDFVQFIQKNSAKLDKMIVKLRDYDTDFFGFKTLEKSYLIKVNKEVVEMLQDLFMRVAINIHYRTQFPKHDIIENIKNTYDLMSQKYFIHATPTLFNSGTIFEQSSSCFLLGTDDSLEGIFKTITDCAKISKWAGGIGVHVSNIRANGARIKSTNGESTGIIPMLKVYNDVARYVNQCFVPETIIYTNFGCKEIQDIQINDQVLTSDGSYKRVLKVIKNTKKDEDIYVIRPHCSVTPLQCTGVHEICVLKADDYWNNRFTPRFISACAIQKGDFMCYPIPHGAMTIVIDGVVVDPLQYIVTTIQERGSIGEDDIYVHLKSNDDMEHFRFILLQHGVLSSGYVSTSFKTNETVYTVKFPRHINICKELGIQPSVKCQFFQHENLLFTPVDDISIKVYSGDVYDLTVEDNHNYTTNCGLVHNSGRRPGSIAVYLEPWHADVMQFLELRLNTGSEELRARDLFLAMWIPDLFMKQVQDNGDWYLMTPDVSPGLQDVYGAEFEELYWKYVREGKYVKKIEASKLWEKIMISQIETGVPYICFKDNVNQKSNQINVGIVKSSNLCSEITEVSSHDSYAVCNLASICVNRFLKDDGTYDWDMLHRVAKTVTFNLNQIIDNNYYPTPETKSNNLENRPIGIGIQGLADLLCRMKLPFESAEAIQLDGDIMETIYHGAVEMSAELADKHGSYPNFAGSPFSKGVLQFDMWGVTPRRYDWTELREKVKKGMRNSLLTALMPTATTSQIQGHNECFEPITSNIYTRNTMAGNFMVVNKYLIEDLKSIQLWDLDMKNDIIDARGSIQNIDRIPQNIKEVYKTAWEIKQKAVIDHAVARGPYVDQSQSMNLFFASPTYEKITSALFYGWKNGLKTGCYYLRSLPAAAPIQFSQEAKKKTEKKEETMFCSLANPEACVMCSS